MFDKKLVDKFKRIFPGIFIIDSTFNAEKDNFIYFRIASEKIRIKCLSKVKIGDKCLIFETSNAFYLLNTSNNPASLNYQRSIEFNKQRRNKTNLLLPFKILYTKASVSNNKIFVGGHSKTPTFLTSTGDFNFLVNGYLDNKGKNNFLSFLSIATNSSVSYLTSKRKKIYQNELNQNFALVFYWLGNDFFLPTIQLMSTR